MFGNNYTQYDLSDDDFTFDVHSYATKRPFLKNRDYKFITDLTDKYNNKLSNGVLLYEILRMNDVGEPYDKIDELELLVNQRLESYADCDIEDIDTYSIRDKNRAKQKLVTYFENNYNGDPYDGYQRNVRLPQQYYDDTVELQGHMGELIVESIHRYIQSPFRSRSHRIDVKNDIIAYFGTDGDYLFKFDISSKILDDVLGIEKEIREVEEYKRRGDTIKKWEDRFEVLHTVYNNTAGISGGAMVTLVRRTHDISNEWAKQKISQFEDRFDDVRFGSDEGETADREEDTVQDETERQTDNKNGEDDSIEYTQNQVQTVKAEATNDDVQELDLVKKMKGRDDIGVDSIGIGIEVLEVIVDEHDDLSYVIENNAKHVRYDD
jgi:hypothetical protein